MKQSLSSWQRLPWENRGFLFDVDATLSNLQREIVPRTKTALKELAKTGTKLGICTGRPLPEMLRVCFPLFPQDAVHIVAGGAQVVRGSGEIIWQSLIPHELAREIAEQAVRLGGDISISPPNGDLWVSPRIMESKVHLGWPVPYRLFTQESFAEISDFRTPVFNISWPTPDVDEYMRTLSDRIEVKKITHITKGTHYYDLTNFGITKARGAVEWSNATGIPLENVAAFGDSENDMEVSQAVGLGIAVANATPGLKNIADHIIGHADQDGVAEFLEQLLA